MLTKLRIIWRVLRGKPVMYRMEYRGSDIVNTDDGLIAENTFRAGPRCVCAIHVDTTLSTGSDNFEIVGNTLEVGHCPIHK